MVEIADWESLTARQRAQAVAIDWSDGDGPSVPELWNEDRPNGSPFQEYHTLYAVERGVPLARVSSIRLELRTAIGTQRVCGIADVITRPDATRRGLASLLMERTHVDAHAEGLRWSFLWTKRSWAAHRAYEKLGYRDVYSSGVALRKVPRARAPKPPRAGYRFRSARAADVGLLESMLDRSRRSRLGFIPRPPGMWGRRIRLGWSQPGSFRILFHRGSPVGYCQAAVDAHDLLSREVVVTDERATRPLLDALERLARGRWIAFGSTTFVRDASVELRRRGYQLVPTAHGVLMACTLRPVARSERAAVTGTFSSPRLSLHTGDTF